MRSLARPASSFLHRARPSNYATPNKAGGKDECGTLDEHPSEQFPLVRSHYNATLFRAKNNSFGFTKVIAASLQEPGEKASAAN